MEDAPRNGFAAALSWAAYAAGVPLVVVATAFMYGASAAPRGSYGDGIIVAIAAGILYFVVLKISRCRHDIVVIAPLIMAPLAFIGGHCVAYEEAHDFAWNYVHTTAPENFSGPQWQNLDRKENFRRFVGYVTDRPGSGAWAYLRLQSSIGTTESHVGKGASGRTEWTVAGIFVWLAWLVQLGLLVIALAAAAGAVAPKQEKPA